MAVTRQELQEWLEQFPADTLVEFAVQERVYGYESYGPAKWVSPELDAPFLDSPNYHTHWEYTDFTHNRFVKPHEEHYNKRYLTLGHIE